MTMTIARTYRRSTRTSWRLTRGALLSLAVLTLPLTAGAATIRVTVSQGRDVLVLRVGQGPAASLVTASTDSVLDAQRLAPGVFDRQAHILYTANPYDGARSQVRAIDVRTGRMLHSIIVPGYYSTQNGDYPSAALNPSVNGTNGTIRQAFPRGIAGHRPPLRGLPALPERPAPGFAPINTAETLTALSFNGRWLALRDAAPGGANTHAIVLDTARLRVVSTLDLRGQFGLDAVNADGGMLYLLQSLPGRGAKAYQVRVYDVRAHRLEPNPLRDADDHDSSTLRGVSWTRVWSPRGDWLFTLYVQAGRQGAFIHALGVQSHQVHCIMLDDPDATAAQLAYYTLAVAPNGGALYAVNPASGHALVVRGRLPAGVQQRLDLGQRAQSPSHLLDGAALSSDGATLFEATDRGVWAVDTRSWQVRATYLSDAVVASVALAGDGRRLYALEPDFHRVVTVSLATGRPLGQMAVDSNAWAIEQVISD